MESEHEHTLAVLPMANLEIKRMSTQSLTVVTVESEYESWLARLSLVGY
jgi:hypothetical protein